MYACDQVLPAMIATKNAAPRIQTVTPADVAPFVTAAFKMDLYQIHDRKTSAREIQVSKIDTNKHAESIYVISLRTSHP